MSKPTKKQMEILTLMDSGWEMGVSSAFDFSAWVQKDGVGRGGAVVRLHANTFSGLSHRGFIEPAKHGYPSSIWKLTESGRAAARAKI